MRTVLAAMVTLFAAAALAGPASACTCITPGWTALDFLSNNDAAFTGVVISVTGVSDPAGCSTTLAVTFNVTGCWKGVADSQITLFTDSDGGCCGYPFVQFQEFLVFGYTQGDNLWSGSCSGNVPRSQADDELALLGPASVPGECATVAADHTTWGLLKVRCE